MSDHNATPGVSDEPIRPIPEIWLTCLAGFEIVGTGAVLSLDVNDALNKLRSRRAKGAWVTRWRLALEASQAHADHEAFECPAMLVLAAASSEPAGIISALEDLSSEHRLPLGFRKGRFDARATPRHVLVVHDASGSGDARAALAGVRAALSRISGGAQATVRLLPLHEAREANTFETRRLAAELVHAGVVPALERRVAPL